MLKFVVGKASEKFLVARFNTAVEARGFVEGIGWVYQQLKANSLICPFAVYTTEEWDRIEHRDDENDRLMVSMDT